MKAGALAEVTKIIAKIASPSSLAPRYRSMEIGRERVRACSEYGIIEICTEPTGLTAPCLLDCAQVMAVTGSEPPYEDLCLESDGDSVTWSTEQEKGSW